MPCHVLCRRNYYCVAIVFNTYQPVLFVQVNVVFFSGRRDVLAWKHLWIGHSIFPWLSIAIKLCVCVCVWNSTCWKKYNSTSYMRTLLLLLCKALGKSSQVITSGFQSKGQYPRQEKWKLILLEFLLCFLNPSSGDPIQTLWVKELQTESNLLKYLHIELSVWEIHRKRRKENKVNDKRLQGYTWQLLKFWLH